MHNKNIRNNAKTTNNYTDNTMCNFKYSRPICVKHPTHFFLPLFFFNNACTRNRAVWMEAQVTCCVRSSTGNLDFVEQNSTNPKRVKLSNTSNVDVLLTHANCSAQKRLQLNNLLLQSLNYLAVISQQSPDNCCIYSKYYFSSTNGQIKPHIQWFPRRHVNAWYSN